MSETNQAPSTQSSQDAAPEFASELQAQEYRDERDVAKAELALADWADKGEFTSTLRAIEAHIDRMPPELRDKYDNGVYKTGTRVLNDEKTLRRLAEEARAAPEMLKTAAKEHGGDERAALEAMMRDRNGPYWRGNLSENLQCRYRDLIREGEAVKERLSDIHLREPARLQAELAYVREHADEPGFEQAEIKKMRDAGISPVEARAIADYYRRLVGK